ncbi:MAG: type II CAAX prenyl endopeptidase Rce1 family protein [Bacillota bacterium]
MKKTLLFITLTLSLTWIIWGIVVYLLDKDLLTFYHPLSIALFTLGGATPSVLGLYFIFVKDKQYPFKENIVRFIGITHPLRFWVFAIVTPVVIGAVLFLGYSAYLNLPLTLKNPWYLFFYYFLYSIIVGGLEEIGWRGYLQDKIRHTLPLFTTGVVIGVVVALWHVPLLLMKYDVIIDGLPYFLALFMFNLYLTYIYAMTKSILLAVVFHASMNGIRRIVALDRILDTPVINYILLGSFIGIGLILLLLAQKKIQT